MADKKKKFSNSEEEYNDALATADPTKIDNEDLEKLAKEAMKKFKSLSWKLNWQFGNSVFQVSIDGMKW